MRLGEMEMEDVEVARFFGALRLGVGIGMFLMPRRVLRSWTGQSADDLPSTIALRGMAGRDIAIGMGLLMAIENGTAKRGWLEAAALSDAADATATIMDWKRMGGLRGAFWLAVEAGSAFIQSQVAATIDD
jgi:hypothetical protein